MFGKWFNEALGFMKAVTVIDGVFNRFSQAIRAACRGALASRMQAAIIFLALCLPLLGAVAPASAQDAGPWHAIEVRGVVYVRAANGTIDDWRPLAPDEILYEDSDVRTWKDGTATLTNGLDTIRLQPNAQVTLRSPKQSGLWLGLQQKLGIIFYDVGKITGRQFSVDAPNLAVLVKGTEFFVDVSASGDSVTVVGGVVKVTARESGKDATLSAGQTASVATGSRGSLVIGGVAPGGPVPGAPASPTIGQDPALRTPSKTGGDIGEDDDDTGSGGSNGGDDDDDDDD
ncbi:MAG TPA: FecR domain-containing protein, partial [Verrucomicrobiae bacterium]|nr:FecR domain-containing protein [Verrucomicrobiae bacterium]